MNKLLKEANQMLKFWCLDADNSLEERAKKKLAEGGRIQVIAPNGDRCSVVRAGENMVQSWSEKRHQWESFPLSKCKILSVDAEPDWITMKGTHVKIDKGESKGEAVKKFIKKKGGDPAPAKSKESQQTYKPGDTLRASNGKRIGKVEKEFKNLRGKEIIAVNKKIWGEDVTIYVPKDNVDVLASYEPEKPTPEEKKSFKKDLQKLVEIQNKTGDGKELVAAENALKEKYVGLDLPIHDNTLGIVDWEEVLNEEFEKTQTQDADPDEVARKIEIEKLIAFIKKHPVGSDNPMISRDLRKARERLSELLDKKKTSDNDATENGAIKQFGQSKQTEVMPVEKKPVLAQDDGSLVGKNIWVRRKGQDWRVYVLQDKGSKLYVHDPYNGTQGWVSRSDVIGLAGTGIKDEYKPDPKVIQILEDLRAHKLTPGAADKMLVQAGVPYVMAGLMVRKPEQYIPVNDEEPVYTLGDKNMKDEKTYQNGDHVKVKNHGTGEEIDLKVLKDNQDGTLEVKAPTGAVITVKKTWIVDSATILDECMEVLRLSGFSTDAYDPKKYEGSRRHETNIWYLETEVDKWRSRYNTAKDQVAAYRKMVSSGQYGKATTEDLKRAERDLEAARMKLEQSLSMLQRAKGQKDEAPTMDAEPTWQDVYKYFTNASLQELEKLDSKDKVISFLLHKGAYGKFPKDKIDEAIRRFMDS